MSPTEPTTVEPESHLEVGRGVAKREELEPQPQPEPEVVAPPEEVDSAGKSQWSTKPSYSDQFAKFPASVRQSARITQVFDLSNKEELAAMNELMTRTIPVGAPGVRVIESERQSFEGKFSVCLLYVELEYKILIKP